MKTFLKIAAVLALLGVVALVVIGMFLGPIVTKAVNAVGPKITGTKVELASASLSPLTGGGALQGLFVGNPPGWTGEKALYIGEVRASVKPASLLGDHVVVNEVFIDGPEFVYERRLLGGSNIDALLKQIEANTGGAKTPPAEQPASGEAAPAKPMKFAVKFFVLQNARMSLIKAGQTITVPLPTITLTDLGVAEGGITADQLAAAVLKRVLAQMGTASVEAVTKGLLDSGVEGAKATGEAAKGALNKLLGR